MEGAVLKANLWNKSVPKVELDQRARDARLRREQLERLAQRRQSAPVIVARGRPGFDSAARLRRWAPKLSDRALSALVVAWIVTITATTLLVSALAVASVWDSAVYFHALRAALSAEL